MPHTATGAANEGWAPGLSVESGVVVPCLYLGGRRRQRTISRSTGKSRLAILGTLGRLRAGNDTLINKQWKAEKMNELTGCEFKAEKEAVWSRGTHQTTLNDDEHRVQRR